MGRLLTNKTNVDNTDADYPNGRIKDDTGSNNGTPVDEDVYGDLHQTEEKGIEEARTWEADVQMDRNADSRLNDWQFFQGRRKVQSLAELYKNGVFRDVGSNIGNVDTPTDCAVFQGELYVADAGAPDVEVFKLNTGAAARTIGNTVFGGIDGIQVVTTGSFGEGLLYGLDTVNNDIRVFNSLTGTRQPSLEINTVITAPVAFQVDPINDRVYVHEGGRVEVFVQSTAAHVPAESFVVTAGIDLFVTPYRDRLYILDTGQTYTYNLSAGGALVAEDLTGLSSASKFHIVGEKVYILENGNTVTVHDIRKTAALSFEDIPNTILGGATNIFIRNGKLYVVDNGTNDVFPIGAINVQEYQ